MSNSDFIVSLRCSKGDGLEEWRRDELPFWRFDLHSDDPKDVAAAARVVEPSTISCV